MRNLLILFSLSIVCSSCSTKNEYLFFDLDNAYSNNLPIDLNALKNKIALVHKNNVFQKDTLAYSYARNLLDTIISQIGFVGTNKNNKEILPSECKKIRLQLYKNLENSIILEDCQTKNKSEFCNEKRETKEALKNIDPEFNFFSVNPSLDELTDLYNKRFLTIEELDFLIMNMYLLISLNRLENG